MSSNTTSPAVKPWTRYRDRRLAHTRELQALAVACREEPRCSACSIVIDLKPVGPCHVAKCPLTPFTAIALPKSENVAASPSAIRSE